MARIAITPGEGTGTIYLSHKNTDSEITLYLPIDNTSATLLTKENSDATLANYVTQDAMEEYVGLHGSSVPTGTIMFFAGSTAPEGFIVWQNIKIYQTQYPNLYAVLNTAGGFAKGTDSTGAYVTLPDINGRVLQATTSASQVGALLEAGLPNIQGGFEDRRSDALWPTSGTNPFWSGGQSSETGALWQIDNNRVGKHNIVTFDASRVASLYSGTSVQPKALSVLACIRT